MKTCFFSQPYVLYYGEEQLVDRPYLTYGRIKFISLKNGVVLIQEFKEL